jgi:AcrR family transcriptional regulator
MTTSTDRKRRSSAEVRKLIAEAAAVEFMANGFERTTIRSVAQRAGVTESMVFRHFESKAELFRATAAAPLVSFMEDYARRLGADPRQKPWDVTYRFVSGLYELCSANRQIVLSLAGTGIGDSVSDGSPLAPCLHALVDGVHRYMEANGNEATNDIRDSVRLTVALVLGASLSGDALFPATYSPDDVRTALARYVLHGAGYTRNDIADHS